MGIEETTVTEVSVGDVSDVPADIPQSPDPVAPINGWVPDESLPCFGLPGAVAPTGYFDPLGFAQSGITLNEVKRNREAEIMHGRVAMLATVGYLVGEAIPSPFGISGPANDQLQQVPLPAFIVLTAGIATAEIKRAQRGWIEPDFGNWSKTLWQLLSGRFRIRSSFIEAIGPQGIRHDANKGTSKWTIGDVNVGWHVRSGVMQSQNNLGHY